MLKDEVRVTQQYNTDKNLNQRLYLHQKYNLYRYEYGKAGA